jgi:hypothetical protein
MNWTQIRQQVLERDNFTCQICFKNKAIDVHHIIPRRKIPLDLINNLVGLCEKCHGLLNLRPLGSRPKKVYQSIEGAFQGKIKFIAKLGAMGKYQDGEKKYHITIPRKYISHIKDLEDEQLRVIIDNEFQLLIIS